MKNRILLSIGLLSAFLLYNRLPKYYFAAEPVCVATFADLDIHSEAYAQAIITTLTNKKPSDFRYFFQTFIQEDSKDYMVVNMRNKVLCFDAKILVEKWGKLAGMKRTNGMSYPKELHELEWKIENRENKRMIIYQDMHTMID